MATWIRLATATASSGSSITSPVFATKDYLHITLEIQGSSDGKWQFGTDTIETGSYYAQRDGANASSAWGANAPRSNIECTYSGNSQYIELWIDNTAGGNKMGIGHVVNGQSYGSGAGTAPNRKESIFKYTKTTSDQINIVSSIGWGTISFAKLTVLGYDVTGTDVYPNLSNGTIFEESDTGKHYMFDGTDTWNEM